MKKFIFASTVVLGFVSHAIAAGNYSSPSSSSNSRNKEEIGRGRVNTDTNLTNDIRRNQGSDPNAPTVRGNNPTNRASNTVQDEEANKNKKPAKRGTTKKTTKESTTRE